MTANPLDRLLNPERLAVPLGSLRLNPVGLLMLGAVFYLTAPRGWPAIFITFAAVAALYGWPLYELARARDGKYSWMYPQIALERIKESLARDRLGLDEAESEVVSYLAAQSSQLSDQYSVEVLLQYDRPPFFVADGSVERRRALEGLVTRGLVRRKDAVVSLNLKPLVALA